MSHPEYYSALRRAHALSARRECASTVVLIQAFEANGGDYWKSMCAAMNTFGGAHAPIRDTIKFLNDCTSGTSIPDTIRERLDKGSIPGFGNSFSKTDESLEDLNALLRYHNDGAHKMLEIIIDCVHQHKNIYPNLATYTAIHLILSKIPEGRYEHELFKLRAPAWEEILSERVNQAKENGPE